jgi:hypothetical protein
MNKFILYFGVIILVGCSSKINNDTLTYYSTELGIQFPKLSHYTIERINNRIILTNECIECNFKTNAIITVLEKVTESNSKTILAGSINEIEALDSSVRIHVDSMMDAKTHQKNLMYIFSRDGVDLKGFAKIIYSRESRKIVTVNCLTSKEEYTKHKNDISDILQGIVILK